MAVTPLVDDDGSGTVGTILNNAWQSALIAALGAWTVMTPPWFNSGSANTLGNGVITGKYWEIGKIVGIKMSFTFGSTSVAGSGAFIFGLPIVAAYPTTVAFPETMIASVGSSAGNIPAVAELYAGSPNTIAIYCAGAPTGVGGSAPFTFVAGCHIEVSGLYEAA